MELKIKIEGVDKVNESIKRIRKIPKDLSQQGLDEIAMAYVSAIRRQLEINNSVASWDLWNSFRAKRVEDNVVQVVTDSKYAASVEWGTENARPPFYKIMDWVELKNIRPAGTDDRGKPYTQRDVAWFIWKSIYESGYTRPHPYIQKARDMARRDVKTIIEKYVRGG